MRQKPNLTILAVCLSQGWVDIILVPMDLAALIWGLIGVVGIILSISFGVLQMNDFKLAKKWFLVAAIIAWGEVFMFGWFTSSSAGIRLLIVFVASGLIAIGLVEAFRYVVGKQDAQIAMQPQSNIELKMRANKLSDDILQFASDKQLSEPKRADFNYNEKVVNQNSAAFKRAMKEWNRNNEESALYYKRMQDDFLNRFGGEYAGVIDDLKKQGAEVESKDNFAYAMTNSLSMKNAAMRLKLLANQIPDTK